MNKLNTDTIVDLNNEAVSYLQEGNYRAAVWDLELSLERLHHDKIWDCHPVCTAAIYDTNALRVTSVPIAPSDDRTYTNVFEFYRRAFRIVTTNPEQQARIHPVTNMIVVKFNMAIAYHDDAIRRNRESHFVLALQLYEDILQMMQHYGIRGHMLLLLAIGNNMGHIHSHLMNFEQTREALYWVRQLALASREHVSTVPYNDYAFFYKTVIVFHGNDLKAAPAA